jgi:hypothetical protein
MTHEYYDEQDYKSGDKVMLINFCDFKCPFSQCVIRRVCKNTIHLSWEDGQYYKYIRKDDPMDGMLMCHKRGMAIIETYAHIIKEHHKDGLT